jgi:hypothetical protein
LIPSDLLLGIDEKSSWDRSQSRLPSLTGTHHHASMKLTLSTLAPGFAAFALELIDRPFDHRPIRKKGFDKPLHLLYDLEKGVPKPTEFFSCCLALYAHCYNNIQILMQNSRKK